MLTTDLAIAARNLALHGRRNLFLGAAIAAVTALLILMGSLTSGIRSSMLESATTLMTGHVNVAGFYKVTSGMAAPLVNDWPRALADAKRLVPELDFSTVRVRGYAKVVSETTSMDMVLGGIDVAAEPGFRRVVQIQQGSLDDLAQPNTILVFEEQARRLLVKVGDPLTIAAPTARGLNNTTDVRVVAVARSVGLLSSFNAFLPSATLRKLYLLNDSTTGAIHLYLKRADDSKKVAARLRGDLAAAGWRMMDADPQPYWQKFQRVASEDWVGQKIDVTSWEDELSFLNWILAALNGLTALLVTVLWIIVGVGIMNTLWIAIRERTREIGTLRAIGMQRTKVLWLFLLEAALLGLAGTVAGAAAAGLVVWLVNAAHLGVPEAVQMFLMQNHLHLELAGGAVLTAVVLLTLITTLFALFPAFRAARLRPVTAMHHIG
jgi:ABC-type lipoprotein release transport system permease subunit